MGNVVEQFSAVLGPCGLNLFGVVSAATYDAHANAALRTNVLAPGTQSVIVFASSGGQLWTSFLEAIRQNPRHLIDEQHPLDAYVSRCLLRASESIPGVAHRWFTPALDSPVHLDFRTLAVQSGLAAPSRLGLVIRPDVGPWLGLRAACFVSAVITPNQPMETVCAGCPGHCEEACPGSAFNNGKWDVLKCSSFHQTSTVCSNSCDARLACPVGRQHRYSDAQLRYHYNRKTGRRALAKGLGITGDRYGGLGPDWGGWSKPSSESDEAG